MFNDRGEFTGPAEISDDVIPGIVIANVGHWHEDSGGWLGNAGVYSDNLVEVVKIDQAAPRPTVASVRRIAFSWRDCRPTIVICDEPAR